MDKEQTNILLTRIKLTADGIAFIDYLKQLSADNYQAFVRDTSEMNEIHKGYAIAIDSLISAFENSDKKPTVKKATGF